MRNIALDALRKAGDPSANPAMTLAPEELDPAEVFALTESLKKSARELGLALNTRSMGVWAAPSDSAG